MAAYGAEVILADSMEAARDVLLDMERRGLGHCLDQVGGGVVCVFRVCVFVLCVGRGE